MAKALPTQVTGARCAAPRGTLAISLFALVSLAGCGEQTPVAKGSTGGPQTGVLPKQPAKAPTESELLASVADQDPAKTVEDLLKVCHGSLYGATEMANCAIKLRRTQNEANHLHVLIGIEDSIKITFRDKTRKVQTRGHAWLIPKAATGGTPTEIVGEELSEFQRLQKLIRSLVLAPLYLPKKVTRQGPSVFAVIRPGGETWRLELKAFTPENEPPILLPAKLTGPCGTVTFHSYLHTGATHLPKKVTLDSLGEQWFQLQISDLSYDSNAFTTPGAKPRQGTATIRREFAPASPKNEPVLTNSEARSCLVFPDPGTWKDRFAALLKNGKTLSDQGQQPADLDFFYVEGDTRYLAMPFEMAAVAIGGKPFVPRKGQKIVHFPPQKIVQIYPDNGTLSSCEAKARKLILPFLAAQGLRVAGPLRVMPWIQVDREVPPERMLQHLRIGFEMPVEKQK